MACLYLDPVPKLTGPVAEAVEEAEAARYTFQAGQPTSGYLERQVKCETLDKISLKILS